MNSMKTNWLRFTTLLSKAVIDTIEPLTDTNRINAFVVDDSLFERTSCKKTELGSKVFDHVSMRYTRVSGTNYFSHGRMKSARERVIYKGSN